MRLLFLIIMSFNIISLCSQTYTGQLINSETGQTVPFANIGIVGKSIGTASNDKGWFKIELDEKYDKNNLHISCIGFENKSYLIKDFKFEIININNFRIELSPKSYLINEVVIRPAKSKTYTLGNFCDPGSTYGNTFYSKELGTEIGVLIKLPRKKNSAYLKSFRFYVGEFAFKTFPVRINIYNLKDGQPHENILIEPIFLDIMSTGEHDIDLTEYNIMVDGDFFISLEYYKVPDISVGRLVFWAVHNRKINRGNSFYRLASHGNWQPEMFDNVGFSVQVEIEQ